MKSNWTKAISILKNDGVIIAPTDTIYGMLGSAFSKKAVKKIYDLKGRDEGKPCIVLTHSFNDLNFFISGINIHDSEKRYLLLEKIWPGKVSVILSVNALKLKYLHRGKNSLAFRMIGKRNKNLYNLIKKAGPLIAPSANPQGLEPAYAIAQSKKYFGDKIDLYINGGTKKSKPSTLVEYKNGKIKILRQGAININIKI